MNKNWLYRVLAIALVAMMALPVFALGEEVFTNEADEVEANVAEYDVALAGDEDEEVPDVKANPVEVDEEVTVELIGETIELYSDDEDYVEKEDIEGKVIGLDAEREDYLEEHGELKSLKFQSKTPKTAKVTGSGEIKIKKDGFVKIKVYAKYKADGSNKWTTLESFIEFDVEDHSSVDYAKLYFGEAADFDEDDAVKNGSKEVDMTPYAAVDADADDDDDDDVLYPLAYNHYDDLMTPDYIEGNSEDVEGYWKWEWSNTKVASFSGTGKRAKKGDVENGVALAPIFHKPGKSKVTFKWSENSKAKATYKFTVKSNSKDYKESKKQIKKRDEAVAVIKSIKFVSNEEAKVEVYFFNGSDAKVDPGKEKYDVAIATRSGEPIIEGSIKLPTLKVNEFKAVTFTFKKECVLDPAANLNNKYFLSSEDELGGYEVNIED